MCNKLTKGLTDNDTDRYMLVEKKKKKAALSSCV